MYDYEKIVEFIENIEDDEIKLYLYHSIIIYASSIFEPIKIKNRIELLKNKIEQGRYLEITSFVSNTPSFKNLVYFLLNSSQYIEDIIPYRIKTQITYDKWQKLITKFINYFQSTEYKRTLSEFYYNFDETVIVIIVGVGYLLFFLVEALAIPQQYSTQEIMTKVLKLVDAVVSSFYQYPLLLSFRDKSFLTFDHIKFNIRTFSKLSYKKTTKIVNVDIIRNVYGRNYKKESVFSGEYEVFVIDKKKVFDELWGVVTENFLWFIVVFGAWSLFLVLEEKTQESDILYIVTTFDEALKSALLTLKKSNLIEVNNTIIQKDIFQRKNKYFKALSRILSFNKVYLYAYNMLKNLLSSLSGYSVSWGKTLNNIVMDVKNVLREYANSIRGVSIETTNKGNEHYLRKDVTISGDIGNDMAPNFVFIDTPKQEYEQYPWLKKYFSNYRNPKFNSHFAPLLLDPLIPLIKLKPIKPDNVKNSIYIYFFDIPNFQELVVPTTFDYYQENYKYDLFGGAVRIRHTNNRMELTLNFKMLHPLILYTGQDNKYYETYKYNFYFLLSHSQFGRYIVEKHKDVFCYTSKQFTLENKVDLHNRIFYPMSFSIFNTVYEIEPIYVLLLVEKYLEDARILKLSSKTVEETKLLMSTMIDAIVYRQNTEYYKTNTKNDENFEGIKRRYIVKSVDIRSIVAPSNIAFYIDDKNNKLNKFLVEYEVALVLQEIFTSL